MEEVDTREVKDLFFILDQVLHQEYVSVTIVLETIFPMTSFESPMMIKISNVSFNC
jgi:hypothetical protein